MNRPYFPLFVDLSRRRIVLIGGGKVAQRRIETLLEFADSIKVVAPKVTERIRQLKEEGRIRWVCDVYRKEMLKGAELVLAATDDAACNEQIIKDCKAGGILVNASSKKELCDFYFPGIVRQGDLVVGISASGRNHREVKEAREKIERALKEFKDVQDL